MKLYMHPVSNTSRPVRLFIAENKIPCDEQIIDLFTGEHYKEPYISLNPNHMVPLLVDGDLRLTESSAILKYLASKFDLPSYPKELKKRAKVDEAMDWFNTQFYRDYGYGLAYPQMYPHHKRPTDAVQAGTIAWAKDLTQGWFKLLDEHWIANKQYVCGDTITIADYFGACLVTLGEVIRCNFAAYPNVARWIGNMKKLDSWSRINEAHYGFANSVKEQSFHVF
ncbi:MAG TPA: glutathione S-transferase family protein [Haliangiales bacterium]|nr:glutathione S-transferase family protein [Haliangiales bacterium]